MESKVRRLCERKGRPDERKTKERRTVYMKSELRGKVKGTDGQKKRLVAIIRRQI